MIAFTFNGEEVPAKEGQSVSAALIAHELRINRHTRINNEPRGIYCGIGICFDCFVTIDGVVNQRGCLTVVRSGMIVESAK